MERTKITNVAQRGSLHWNITLFILGKDAKSKRRNNDRQYNQSTTNSTSWAFHYKVAPSIATMAFTQTHQHLGSKWPLKVCQGSWSILPSSYRTHLWVYIRILTYFSSCTTIKVKSMSEIFRQPNKKVEKEGQGKDSWWKSREETESLVAHLNYVPTGNIQRIFQDFISEICSHLTTFFYEYPKLENDRKHNFCSQI